MELGRLFRDEGITPAMIQKNRVVLVNAMKTILEKEAGSAESMPRSYATAPEYPVENSITSSFTQPRNVSRLDLPSVSSPLSLLGSAPPRSAGFTDAFLENKFDATSSLDQKQNVDDGMQSLLKGMSQEDSGEEYRLKDFDNVEMEDHALENVRCTCVNRSSSFLIRLSPRMEGYYNFNNDRSLKSSRSSRQ